MQAKCLRCLLWSLTLHHLAWAKETGWLHRQQRAVDQYPYRRLWFWYQSQALQVMNCLCDIYPHTAGLQRPSWVLQQQQFFDEPLLITRSVSTLNVCQHVGASKLKLSSVLLKLASQLWCIYLNCMRKILKSNRRMQWQRTSFSKGKETF